MQLTPQSYKRPADVPEGGTLVVGASASGLQIARELAGAGRRVTLAVGNHLRLPRRYRGADILWWMHRIGSLQRLHTGSDDLDRLRRLPSLPLAGDPHSGLGIDRRHGLIRTWSATDAARHDGGQLPGLLDKANIGSSVWADTAYRSAKNEAHLAAKGFTSRIHRKKPMGKPMPKNVSRANAAKSEVRAHVEHVFARQKGPMALVIRTIGLARATVKIGLANLVYNMRRMVWLAAA